jgi:hypothetical protein
MVGAVFQKKKHKKEKKKKLTTYSEKSSLSDGSKDTSFSSLGLS